MFTSSVGRGNIEGRDDMDVNPEKEQPEREDPDDHLCNKKVKRARCVDPVPEATSGNLACFSGC